MYPAHDTRQVAECPQCGSTKFYWIAERNAIKCASCDKWAYLTQGTVMEKSSTPICTWFFGAYLMVTMTPGISGVQFQRQSGIKRYETAFQILHKLRAAMDVNEQSRLKGEIEVDETFVGGEKEGIRGRGAWGKSIVVGGVEVIYAKDRKGVPYSFPGRIRLSSIIDASEDSLMEFATTNITSGSTLVTDGWAGYHNVDEYGFEHTVIRGESSKEVAKELVHIHRVFGNLKTWLNGTHHGVSAKHLQAYLNEFAFRFNHRQNPWLAFNTILGLASDSEAPTYDELYSGEWVHPGEARALING